MRMQHIYSYVFTLCYKAPYTYTQQNRIKRVKKRIDLERRENEDARKDMHQRIDHRLQMISNLDDNKRKVNINRESSSISYATINGFY